MKDKTVNNQSKSQALSNKELQFAIDNTVASLRTPPFGGQVSSDAKEMLLAHLHELLLCQRSRARALMSVENSDWMPGEKCYWETNGEAVFIGFCPSDEKQCALEYKDQVRLALVDDLRKVTEIK